MLSRFTADRQILNSVGPVSKHQSKHFLDISEFSDQDQVWATARLSIANLGTQVAYARLDTNKFAGQSPMAQAWRNWNQAGLTYDQQGSVTNKHDQVAHKKLKGFVWRRFCIFQTHTQP